MTDPLENPENDPKELILRHLAGELSSEASNDLARRIRGDRELETWFLRALRTQAGLPNSFATLQLKRRFERRTRLRRSGRFRKESERRSRRILIGALAAAGVILFIAVVGTLSLSQSPSPDLAFESDYPETFSGFREVDLGDKTTFPEHRVETPPVVDRSGASRSNDPEWAAPPPGNRDMTSSSDPPGNETDDPAPAVDEPASVPRTLPTGDPEEERPVADPIRSSHSSHPTGVALGRVLRLDGAPEILRGKDLIALEQETMLLEGDEIRTGNGTVMMEWTGKANLSLGGSTFFALPEGTDPVLREGTLRIGSFGNDSSFALETPLARLDMAGVIAPVQVTPEKTSVHVEQGTCVLYCKGASSMRITARKGKAVEVSLRNHPKIRKFPVAPLHPAVDPYRLEKAVSSGAYWVRNHKPGEQLFNHPEAQGNRIDSLMLLALYRSGTLSGDADLERILKTVLNEPLQGTYETAFLAVALAEIDAKRFRWKIARCGQFLVDNQCLNGQWSYGEKVEMPDRRGFSPGAPPSSTIRILARPTGPEKGCNSNLIAAVMGLDACNRAGIVIPPKTLRTAADALLERQLPDGGWGYIGQAGTREKSSGAMTAGGVVSLLSLERLGALEKTRCRKAVQRGMHWLSVCHRPDTNPRSKYKNYLSYYLFMLERLGGILKSYDLGKGDWFGEVAQMLLERQDPDGSWQLIQGKHPEGRTIDTCFGLLILRRGSCLQP